LPASAGVAGNNAASNHARPRFITSSSASQS
jgi:hypothetical protein